MAPQHHGTDNTPSPGMDSRYRAFSNSPATDRFLRVRALALSTTSWYL